MAITNDEYANIIRCWSLSHTRDGNRSGLSTGHWTLCGVAGVHFAGHCLALMQVLFFAVVSDAAPFNAIALCSRLLEFIGFG